MSCLGVSSNATDEAGGWKDCFNAVRICCSRKLNIFLRPRSHEYGTERNDVDLFQKTKEFLQVFTRERLETFRSVPKSGRL